MTALVVFYPWCLFLNTDSYFITLIAISQRGSLFHHADRYSIASAVIPLHRSLFHYTNRYAGFLFGIAEDTGPAQEAILLGSQNHPAHLLLGQPKT